MNRSFDGGATVALGFGSAERRDKGERVSGARMAFGAKIFAENLIPRKKNK